MSVTIISFLALVANVAIGAINIKRQLTSAAVPDEPGGHPRFFASGVALALVFCAIQVFVGIWSALGLAQDDVVSALTSNIVLVGCAQAGIARPYVAARLNELTSPDGRFPHPVALSVILMVAAGIFAMLALEVPSNHDLLWMYPLCALLEFALITAALAGLFFLFQRRSLAPGILVAGLMALGLAEYFVVLFKSMPIQPGDLFALSTAMAVSAGYEYTLSAFCLYGIALGAVALVLCSAAGALRPARPARTRKKFLLNLLVGALCIGGIVAHIGLFDYYGTLGIQIYTWRPLESYYRQGFIPSFISSAQTIIPPKPQNYDAARAQDLLDEYAATYDETDGAAESRTEATAQFDEEKPTVIAVMNETFSDLSIYQNLHAGYEGPQFFKSISDAASRGALYVSAFGGGTCNTEFEFLTGNSMAYLGQGVYPYTIYNLSKTENLARQFSELGYSTTAIHPNHATNWNRENVYKDFGFDQFLSINDFQDADTLRGMVTDAATYDKILELLEENDDPQFIFDVTMQNHSGYTTGLIPEDMRSHYLIDGTYNPEANEYLSLINESDRALEDFISALKKLDRKVVLVFFGDHQPYFPSSLNDAWFTGEDEATHAERLWQTDYIIWANYDLAGNAQTSETHDISVNYLGARLMELIGAPLTDYQKAQLAAHDVMPAINTTGYQDRKGVWYLTGTSADEIEGGDGKDAAEARTDLSNIQYLKLFDTGESIFTMNLQSAANETDPNLAPGTTKIK